MEPCPVKILDSAPNEARHFLGSSGLFLNPSVTAKGHRVRRDRLVATGPFRIRSKP